jgi:RNA polymerase sigma factor (TIGR02999 family)
VPHSKKDTVTNLLTDLRDGRHDAYDELFPLVYEELRALAHRQRRRWRGNETLGTTALVHEAYLKLVAQPAANWETEAHFLAAAGRAVRHILINYARDQQAQKRGGDFRRESLSEVDLLADPGSDQAKSPEAIMVLDDALTRLAVRSERQSRIVECRFFGGMTIKQTAVALGISAATVERGWAMAQAWLYRELRPSVGGADA